MHPEILGHEIVTNCTRNFRVSMYHKKSRKNGRDKKWESSQNGVLNSAQDIAPLSHPFQSVEPTVRRAQRSPVVHRPLNVRLHTQLSNARN